VGLFGVTDWRSFRSASKYTISENDCGRQMLVGAGSSAYFEWALLQMHQHLQLDDCLSTEPHRHDCAWHLWQKSLRTCRGDYFSTVAPAGATMSVVVHQLSKQTSQNPFRKNRGRITCTSFHPTKPLFLVATQNNVRIYNLAKQTLMKKLLAGGGVITSISMHPSGDHVLLGTEDNRCIWYAIAPASTPCFADVGQCLLSAVCDQ
jgi:WD40 repeat protein